MSKIETLANQPDLSPAKRALLEKWKRGNFSKTAAAESIPRRQEQGNIPASFTQQRLWFLDRLVPNSPAYNISFAIRLDGTLDEAALVQSLNEIVRRHEALRTTFAQNADGQPIQAIAPELAVELPLVDLAALPENQREAALQQQIDEETRRPFDLARGPLVRTTLIRQRSAGTRHEHIFLLSLHHIISDTWSIGVFIQELVTLYAAFSAGKPSPLAELPIQYADFALWQRGWLREDLLDKHLSFWQQQLQPDGRRVPTMLELLTDHPRPPIQTFRGAVQRFVLPPALTEALRTLSRQEDVTLFMLLLTAFQSLLHRYSGQRDILVGSPIAGRSRPETEALIGFFANTILLRGSFTGNPTFRTLLQQVRATTLGAYAHQDLPFEQIVEALQPERDMSRNPLFQVMFVLQNTPMPSVTLPDLQLSTLPTSSGTAKFDLWLSVTETGDELAALLEYNTDLFDPPTITRMIDHFQTLLQAAVADPTLPIARLPLLTEAETCQQIQWNATDVPYDLDRCLHWLIEEQAARTPDAIAVSYEDARLSYRELNERANRLAHHLRGLGLGPDTPVGICIERSLELVVGLLAILKAGGAYVPLDPSYPQERLAFLIGDAQVPVLITSTALAERLHDPQRSPGTRHSALVVRLDTDWPQIATQPESPPASGVTPDNLAYMIYTSGSTGQPKGAMISHRAIVNRLLWMQETYRLGDNDRVLQKTPFSFDVSVWEFFWPLLTGARLVVARPEGHKDPEYLIDVINREQITTIHFVPSMLQSFVDARGVGSCRSLRRVICSGEALPLELQQRYAAWLSAELHNLYGPTEAAVDVTWWPCERAGLRRTVPIGRPIANTQIQVLDADLNRVPIGVPGELYIGGVQLARGYSQRPDLTAERFIPDPFARTPGSRLYKTGDRARYAPDGAIEYLGRIDQQVKLRGFRIELGEIEATLRQHPAVREAIVLSRQDRPDHSQLVAYILPEPHTEKQEPKTENQNGEQNSSGLLPGSIGDEQVTSWEQVFDTAYAETDADADAAFNIIGWNSSYTGEALPAATMQEWVDQTVDRILALRPRRVLEIGCGTGLLLFRVAPECERYVGTDISAVALAALSRHVQAQRLAQVALYQRPADDLAGIADERFDVVIINSVAQYFPSAAYLVRVLEGAAQMVAAGGALFIGDVRNRRLLKTFHTSVELYRANAELATGQLQQRIQLGIAQEHELALDPEFFAALQHHLPRIRHVSAQLKRGLDHNELTKFRYDVTLHVDAEPALAQQSWRDWQQEQMTIDGLRRELHESAPTLIAFANVPNLRVQADLQAQALLAQPASPPTVGELRARLSTDQPSPAIDPEQLWALERDLPYIVEVRCSAADKCYDLVLRHASESAALVQIGAPSSAEQRDWNEYANNPLQARLSQQLTPLLRSYLQERLPEFMTPAAFVLIERLPVTPNGKIDREALPPPLLLDLENELVAPRSLFEQILADIWAQVLRLERVGVHHNFFALGGDSILSLQIITRAQQAGLRITTKQMFQYQTIAELAEVAERIVPPGAEQGLVTGPAPLTPTQREILEQPDLRRGDQALVLETPAGLRATWLQAAVAHVVQQHDALRLRIVRDRHGWQQTIAAPDPEIPFSHVDLSGQTPEDQPAIATAIAAAHERLNLATGPALVVVFVDHGSNLPGRLALVSHELVLDQRSWSLVLHDLWTAYQQLSRGEAVGLSPKTASFQEWAGRLAEIIDPPRREDETNAYWRDPSCAHAAALPQDSAAGTLDQDLAGHSAIDIALSAAETEALLDRVHGPYRTQIEDLLLTALVQACTVWTGSAALLVDLERDGRSGIFGDLDPARTVGCFTSRFPLLLDLTAVESDDSGAAIKLVKEQLRGVPCQGIGYGLLRQIRSEASHAPQAQMRFVYQGASDPLLRDIPLTLISHSRQTTREYALDLSATLSQDRLHLAWRYDPRHYSATTIEQIARGYLAALRALIDHCQLPGVGGYTPSDFPLARLSQRQLDQILPAKGAVTNIYPLAPAQEHMVLRYLSQPGPGLYLVYGNFFLQPLNVTAFARAWQQVIDRHTVLRTSFVWEDLERPLQVVHAQVPMPVERHDWRGLSPQEQQERLAAYLQSVREQGFDLSRAPFTRLALFQVSEEAYQFFWGFNYMLQDGWSFPLLMKDFFDCYEAACQGRTANHAQPQPYGSYIARLQQQDLASAEHFWRAYLKDFTAPTLLIASQSGATAERRDGFFQQYLALSVATTNELQALGQRHQLTLNTLVQGAWALLLSWYTGEREVVFGSVASGRSIDLPGIETMVGSFNTILPMRAAITPETPLLAWLQAFQLEQVEQRQYEYTPLVKIKAWSEIPADQPLFESYLTFENFPIEAAIVEKGAHWMRPLSSETQTEHPLRVTVWPLRSLSLYMSYYGRCFDDPTITRMLRDFQSLLEAIVKPGDRTLGELHSLAGL